MDALKVQMVSFSQTQDIIVCVMCMCCSSSSGDEMPLFLLSHPVFDL